ncbi:MAG: hypothetical protein ACLS37_08225 [Alistipes sp.]
MRARGADRQRHRELPQLTLGDGIADRLRTGRLENLELTLSPEKPSISTLTV